MGQSDGEGVGLVGTGVVAEPEERPGHEGHLFLFGGPSPGGGFFDQLGWVFVDGESPAGGGEEGRSPGGPEDDGGAGILDIDDQFDGKGPGGMLPDELLQTVVNLDETFMGGAGGGVFDRAGGQNDGFFGRSLQHGITGGPEGGVEGEDSHGKIVPIGVNLSREGRFDPLKTAVKIPT